MEKTVIFGRNEFDNANVENSKLVCANCEKLKGQLSDLNVLLAHRQSEIQNIINGSTNQSVKIIQNQLLTLRQNYTLLKKQAKQIEKESDDLFAENGLLQKQLTSCKLQIKSYQEGTQNAHKQLEKEDKNQSQKSNDKKQLEVELFVMKEKVRQLQVQMRKQSEQILQLKQHLRKRNKQQESRHRLIQLYS